MQKIRNFSLAQASDVPEQLQQSYSQSGFSPDLRAWHINRLPVYNYSRVETLCPGCGNYFTSRGLQIDHIIPVKVYVRYRLFEEKSKGNELSSYLVKSICSEQNNLILLCSSCNNAKSDSLLSETDFRNLSDRALTQNNKKKLANSKNLLGQLRRLKPALSDYFFKGHSWNLRKPGLATNTSFNSFELEFLTKVELEINHNLTRSRPAWFTNTKSELLRVQFSRENASVNARLCFYCYGLFNESTFDVDHIRPKTRLGVLTKNKYNDPQNLLPVCATCNRSKGNELLSSTMLQNLVQARVAAGLPGIESATNLVVGEGINAEEVLDQQRNRLLSAFI